MLQGKCAVVLPLDIRAWPFVGNDCIFELPVFHALDLVERSFKVANREVAVVGEAKQLPIIIIRDDYPSQRGMDRIEADILFAFENLTLVVG
jgi:hypothetical protein